MNFDLGEEDRALQQKIKGLFDSGTLAQISQMAAGDNETARETILRCSKMLAGVGYLDLGLNAKEDATSLVTAQECLATISPSLYMAVEVSARLFGRLVAIYGTHEQQEEILPDLKAGNLIGTVTTFEEEITSETEGDVTSLAGTIEQVINGPFADKIALPIKHQGGTVFYLLNRAQVGLTFGEPVQTLGFRHTQSASLSLVNAQVMMDQSLGPFEGDAPIQELLIWEDQVMSSASLGVIQRTFQTALAYAKSHNRDGKPLIAHQEVGFKLAEMLTLLQTSQLLAYRAAWMSETDDREAALLGHCAKVFCSESAEVVSSQALQILGQRGLTRDKSAEEGYLDAKYLQIAGIPSELARNRIGDELLG